MAIYKIVHVTKYHYNWPVKESINEIRMFPHHFDNQKVLAYELVITSNPAVSISTDFNGNRVGNFYLLPSHSEMTIKSSMTVRINHSLKIPELDTITVADLAPEKECSIYLLRLSYPEVIEKQDQIQDILNSIDYQNRSIIAIAQQCSQYIFENFTYTKGITNIETTIDEILSLKKGVCQDFTNVLLQLLRTAGIPARYVSGYICPYENEFRGEGATHAWVEVYSPTQGWLGIDPTNNIWTMNNHVKLAVGKNFKECSPAKGTFKGLSKQTLTVSVAIRYENGSQMEEISEVQLPEIPAATQQQLDYLEQLQQQQ
jgi:transglutaminase-like putative cysteine protease